MSTPDIEDLRAQALAEGDRLGWATFGRAAQLDGETIRQFAKGAKDRKAHPDTLVALRRYFSPVPPSALHAKAEQAHALIQQGMALLSEVVRLLPADPDTQASIDAAEKPMRTAQLDAPPGTRRRGAAEK